MRILYIILFLSNNFNAFLKLQLQYVFQGLSSVSYNNYVLCASGNFSTVRSDQLKAIIREYFLNDYPKDLKLEIEVCLNLDKLNIKVLMTF